MNTGWALGTVLTLRRKPVVQLSPWQGLASKSPFSPSVLQQRAFGFLPPATLPSARSRKRGKVGCPGSKADSISAHSDCSSSSPLLGELPGMQIFGANWRRKMLLCLLPLSSSLPTAVEKSIISPFRNVPVANYIQCWMASTVARSN